MSETAVVECELRRLAKTGEQLNILAMRSVLIVKLVSGDSLCRTRMYILITSWSVSGQSKVRVMVSVFLLPCVRVSVT